MKNFVFSVFVEVGVMVKLFSIASCYFEQLLTATSYSLNRPLDLHDFAHCVAILLLRVNPKP